jgi:hypothetical protein
MKRKRPGFFLAWVDMLYGQMAGFLFLFVLSVMLINPPQTSKPGIDMNAEFLIKMSWPDDNFDDVDLHMLLPSGKHLHFRNREVEYALLDHDDLGTNGRYQVNGQLKRVGRHQETIMLRAIVPGNYVVNLHVYRVNRTVLGDGGSPVDSKPVLPYPVHVTLTKLNPRVDELASVDVVLHEQGEQRTAFAFTVLPNGFATVDHDTDIPFIPQKEFASATGAEPM